MLKWARRVYVVSSTFSLQLAARTTLIQPVFRPGEQARAKRTISANLHSLIKNSTCFYRELIPTQIEVEHRLHTRAGKLSMRKNYTALVA